MFLLSFAVSFCTLIWHVSSVGGNKNGLLLLEWLPNWCHDFWLNHPSRESNIDTFESYSYLKKRKHDRGKTLPFQQELHTGYTWRNPNFLHRYYSSFIDALPVHHHASVDLTKLTAFPEVTPLYFFSTIYGCLSISHCPLQKLQINFTCDKMPTGDK